MKVYTYSDARQKLASLLDRASAEGEVGIKRKDGRQFVIRPVTRRRAALDVRGVDVGLTAAEIVAFVRESRERHKSG